MGTANSNTMKASKNKNEANVAVVENVAVANVAVENKNKNKKNNVVAEEVVVKSNVANQSGGVAPVGMKGDFFQPTKAVGYWAVTADAPTPPADQMRNVAHGGARKKTRKHKKSRKQKKGKSHKKSRKHTKSRKQKKSLKRRK